jgi:N-acetyl-1-D-myo-inositol-2-amino-2-deoxy-alpha-D-glucopyranoside deacetylase
MQAEATGGVLFVHAHPDDESMGTGGTIARLVAEGVRVDLVTCTDGAEGEIHDPTLDPDEARPQLAQIRAEELACSVDALGSGAIHHHMLGYRDSGMIGTDANAHPDSFWQADLDEATRRLTDIVRAARPSVIVSYDENGNYGHPDHINAALIARKAYQASRGEAWQVARFHEIAFVRERWFELMSTMKERGIALPWNLGEEVPSADAADQPAESDAIEFGRSDAEVTTRVDVSGYLDAKRRSMDCHKTSARISAGCSTCRTTSPTRRSTPSTTSSVGSTVRTSLRPAARRGSSGSERRPPPAPPLSDANST